jgi:hypothetical protein
VPHHFARYTSKCRNFLFLQYTREGNEDGGIAGAASFCLPGAGDGLLGHHHFDAAPNPALVRQNDAAPSLAPTHFP